MPQAAPSASPESIEGAYDATWQQRLVEGWANLIGPFERGSVVEIGPGRTDKIAQALRMLNFRGVLTVLEPTQLCADWVDARYRMLLPQAEIEVIRASFQDYNFSNSCDLIVMNHVFDDALLLERLPVETWDCVFNALDVSAEKTDLMQRSWASFRDGAYEVAKHDLISQLMQFFADSGARRLLASHYESWFLRKNGMAFVNDVSKSILNSLAHSFGRQCIIASDTGLGATWLHARRGLNLEL